jgi:hypothetical protein
MLLIAVIGLAILWTVVVAVVLALCVGAALGDRQVRDGPARRTRFRLIAG